MKTLSTAHRELVSENVEYVRALAARHYPAYAATLEYDDLVGCGMVGLCRAARRYRRGRGARFGTFAHYRIYGAMLDGVRRQGALPRRDYFVGGAELETETPVEAAVHSFSPASETLDEQLERGRQRSAVQGALGNLPEDARQLLQLIYFEDLTFEEAGRKLGISKSWISRLHAKALKQLKKAIAAGCSSVTADR